MAETTKNNYKHRRWQATDEQQTIPVCRGATDEHPALARWRAQFAKDGASALGRALSGQVSLGPYDRDRPSGALVQILRKDEHANADQSLHRWLSGLLGKPVPTGLSGKRFADALQEAFWLAGRLGLKDTCAWCAEHRDELSLWLRDFHFGNSRDPKSALQLLLEYKTTQPPLAFFRTPVSSKG